MLVQQLQCVLIMKSKSDIRKEIRNKLKTHESNSSFEQLIIKTIELKEYTEADIVLSYIPFQQEADTRLLIQKSFADKKIIGLPKIDSESMQFYECTTNTNFTKNTYGIYEPNVYKPLNLSLFSRLFCTIPGLAFTKEGKRLGRGKAYYDNFLNNLFANVDRKNITLIGFCHSIQLVDKIPTEEHDIEMDYIMTEKELIKCKK